MACKNCKKKSLFTPEFEKKMDFVEKSVINFTIVLFVLGVYGLVRLIMDVVSYIKGII